MTPWQQLQLAPTQDVRAIKRAYALRLKQCRPEQDPAGFARLRQAYEMALELAEPKLGWQRPCESEEVLADAVDVPVADFSESSGTDEVARASSVWRLPDQRMEGGESSPAFQAQPIDFDNSAIDCLREMTGAPSQERETVLAWWFADPRLVEHGGQKIFTNALMNELLEHLDRWERLFGLGGAGLGWDVSAAFAGHPDLQRLNARVKERQWIAKTRVSGTVRRRALDLLLRPLDQAAAEAFAKTNQHWETMAALLREIRILDPEPLGSAIDAETMRWWRDAVARREQRRNDRSHLRWIGAALGTACGPSIALLTPPNHLLPGEAWVAIVAFSAVVGMVGLPALQPLASPIRNTWLFMLSRLMSANEHVRHAFRTLLIVLGCSIPLFVLMLDLRDGNPALVNRPTWQFFLAATVLVFSALMCFHTARWWKRTSLAPVREQTLLIVAGWSALLYALLVNIRDGNPALVNRPTWQFVLAAPVLVYSVLLCLRAAGWCMRTQITPMRELWRTEARRRRITRQLLAVAAVLMPLSMLSPAFVWLLPVGLLWMVFARGLGYAFKVASIGAGPLAASVLCIAMAINKCCGPINLPRGVFGPTLYLSIYGTCALLFPGLAGILTLALGTLNVGRWSWAKVLKKESPEVIAVVFSFLLFLVAIFLDAVIGL